MRLVASGSVAVISVGFLVLPFLVVAGSSLDTGSVYNIRFPPGGVSFQRYLEISPVYYDALYRSIVVGIGVALAATVIGVMTAFSLVRGGLPARVAVEAFFKIPLQIPLVVTGAVYLQCYYFLAAVWGITLTGSLFGLGIAHLFIAIPYCVGACTAVLLRFDPVYEEAAQIAGASDWSVFWRVTLPAMKPGIVAGAFYAFIISFGDVPIAIFVVTSDTVTLPVRMFHDMTFDLNPGMLAMSTLVAIGCSLLMLGIQKVAGLDVILPGK